MKFWKIVKGYQVKNGHRQNFTLVKIEKFKKVGKKATTSNTKKKTSNTKEEKKDK